VARRAGDTLAITVTTMPSTRDTMIVRALSTESVFGRSMPRATNRAERPLARNQPPIRPSTEAMTPMARPSSSTERRTCLRDAPSVRSVASSRIRWATVIDSVL